MNKTNKFNTSVPKKATKFVPNTETNPLVKGLSIENNYALTENGALTNKSTLNDVLDWFGAGGALRTRSEADVIKLFSRAFSQDKLLATKILFYFRDIRMGQGERKTFRVLLNWLANRHSDVVRSNVMNVPFFGRWDDLYSLVGTPMENDVFNIFTEQLKEDVKSMEKGESVSLLAKWLKSENASSSDTRKLAQKTREALKLTPRQYRKILSALRKYIDVIEVKMCSGEWSEIDFEKVTSKASLIYRKAFGKHDQVRYAAYLASVEKGEAKMNAGAVYPYEIVEKIGNARTEQDIKALDLLWNSMPNWLEGNEHSGMVIADTSGSMCGRPITVAISLAIYFAQRNIGPFKDTWMNFSNQPTFQRLVGTNLKEFISNMDRNNWDARTNLQSAFDLILGTAIKHKVAQSDMPSVLYIVSDMEFDIACTSNKKTNFEVMKDKFEAAGYKLPRVVWWNVNARNDQHPIKHDETGTALVSGCSPSILKSLLSAKSFDPMSIVMETVNNSRYDRVVV
jgi:hypothetical protein